MSDGLLAAVETKSSAYVTGQLIGMLVVWVALGAGLIKSFSIMRRPRTSSLCVSSLACLLGAWLLMSAVTSVRMLVDLPRWTLMAGSLLGMLLLVASVVLALAGLVVWYARRGDYDQGRAQAIWSLVIAGLLFVAAAAGMVSELRNRSHGTPDRGTRVAMAAPEISEMREYSEFGFRFGHPRHPWVPLEKFKPAEGTLAAYTRQDPEIYGIVIAEPNIGDISVDDAEAVVRARLESLATGLERLPVSTHVIGGLTFRTIPIKVAGLKGTKLPLYYEYWVACSEETVFTFTFWASPSAQEALAAASSEWMKSFTPMTPMHDAGGVRKFADEEALAEGYATALEPLGWGVGSLEDFPEAWFFAIKGEDCAALVSMPHPGWSKVRREDVDEVMLAMLNIQPQEKLTGPESTSHHGLPARLYQLERPHNGHQLHFQIRIVQAAGRSWMLVVWGMPPVPSAERDRAVEAVRLFVPPEDAVPRALSPALLKAHGAYFNDLGIKFYQRQDYRQAELHFREAWRHQPENTTMLVNVADALARQARPEEALRVIDSDAGEAVRAAFPVRVKRAELLAQSGDVEGALAAWKEIFDDGYENDDHVLTRLNLLLSQGRPAEALEIVAGYASSRPSAKVDRWHASVLARNDRFDDALAKLEPRASASPPDLDALYLKGELENDAGRYEAAEKTAAALREAGEDTARTHLIAGWSEWHRKAWKAAHESFQKAAALAPEDDDIQSALAMTAGALGQGTAKLSTTPLDPVPVPPSLQQALDQRGDPPPELIKGYGAYYLHRLIGVHYKPGEPSRVTHYYKVKIVDQSGLEAFNGLSHSFHPSAEVVYVNRLTVTDEKGVVVQEGTNTDAFVTGESGEMATGSMTLQIPVPGLRQGGTLEAVITIQDKSKATAPPFRRELLTGTFPARARAWFLSGDAAAVRFVHAPSLKPMTDSQGRAFAVFDTPALRSEPFMAPLDTWQPWVVAGPSGGSWKQVGSDYLAKLADRLADDPSAADLAARLCEGRDTAREKADAIIRHVQTSLTYKALEFGTRAQIPSTVAKIQADQYGDCKDHTLLLYHLLRRAGIPSQLALVNTEWKIHDDIPSLDQFDHMILHAPGIGSQPWIDATQDWADLANEVPHGLAGREALILDPGGARFATIGPAESIAVSIDRDVSVKAGGDLEVEETLTLAGAAAAWAREWFLNAPRNELPNLIRRQLHSHGLFELTSAELADAETLSKPLRIKLRYHVPEAFDAARNQISLPFYWERDYLGHSPVGNRKSPFRFAQAMDVKSTTRVAGLPEPGRLAIAPPARGENPTGPWEIAVPPNDAATVVQFHSLTSQGDHATAEWPAFQNDRRSLLERLRRPLTVERP